MSKQILAIALCRVSSLEQLQNNSLKHQQDIVINTAETLEAKIPEDGVWAGQASSKVGVNYNRKDLLEMYDYCKRNSAVKYIIVSEVDRFMRSPDEQTYWYVKFGYELKVKVWFADKPELNADTHEASLFRYLEGWRAGGSNVERINKSINGQTAALKDGRYPFAPKPGYKRGYERGIPEIHEVRGPILKDLLIKIATRQMTPTQALIELNKSAFMVNHAQYKMDKFRKIVTDPFYAGIVEINKQVKVRNENGLHKPLITQQQHYELIKIMENKKKTQIGPRKGGNPKYPLSNIVSCDLCADKTNGRLVGFDHGNGKNKSLVYEKYRCRACKRYWTREDLHSKVVLQFKAIALTTEGQDNLMEALNIVWRQREHQTKQEKNRIEHQIKRLNTAIDNQVEALTDPENSAVKQEIMNAISKKKDEVAELEGSLERLTTDADADKDRFLKFAFNFVGNMGDKFLELNPENRMRCKQIVFPAGFNIDAENKVYTREISPLYRLGTMKKDAKASQKEHLVRVRGL